MNGPSSDRNLLLGIVAPQMDFIARDDLIRAMQDWTLDKSRSLSEILVKNGALDPADRTVLESLVERHIARHDGDVDKSLSSIELIVPSGSTLELLGDPDIQQSLHKLRPPHDLAGHQVDSERTGLWVGSGTVPLGRFRIISLHDEGGLGSVYRATDAEVHREVALKKMKEEIASDPQLRARFVFEAEITGNLEHPGIVPVYGKGEFGDGRPYYAMRFVRGVTLKAAVDMFHGDPSLRSDSGTRRRELQGLLRRFLVVCETMAYAHSRGIIHRDLKPRNIMLGPYGETLVLDWGMAKVVGHKEVAEPADVTLRPPSGSDVQPTDAGSRLGTPPYMSPEQARGEIERLGPASDIYSLGATLYYVLTKRAPFVDGNLPALLSKIEHGEFPLPRDVHTGVDRALEAICLRAMKILPDERYESCRAFADDLERWLADQPVSAYNEPLSATAMRWVRQHRAWVAAAGLLALCGLIGLVLHDVRLGQEQRLTKSALKKLSEEQVLTKRALDVVGQEQLRTKQALDQAAGQLKMTRGAYRDLLYVSGTSLANFPGTEELRLKLATGVLENYQRLLQSYPGDPGILLEMARVYRIVAGIHQITNQFDGAANAYEKAVEIYERWIKEPALGKDAREWLAQTLTERAELHRISGKTRKAVDDLKGIIALSGSLADVENTVTLLKIKASAQIGLSEALGLHGQPQESCKAAHDAVEVLDQIRKRPDAEPTDDRLQWLLAMALTDRGTARTVLQSYELAVADHRRALLELNKISAKSEYFTAAQLQRSTSLNELGDALATGLKRYAEAKQAFDESIRIMEPLARKSESYPYYREALANAYGGRGAAQLAAGSVSEALSDCEASLNILKKLSQAAPRNPDFLARLGKVAATAFAVRARLKETDAANRYLDDAIAQLERSLAIDTDRRVDSERLEDLKAKREQLTSERVNSAVSPRAR